MARARVVRGGTWDHARLERLLGCTPFDVEPVHSPVIVVDGRIEPDATAWLKQIYSRTARTTTASGYADSLAVITNFLLDRDKTLRSATRADTVAFVNHRAVDFETRVAGTTFRRDRTVLKGFYMWLREEHGLELPFTLEKVWTNHYGETLSVVEGRGIPAAAAAGTPLEPPQIPLLIAGAWRIQPDGSIGNSVLGPRDAAIAGLGLATGARAETMRTLTVWEVPQRAEPGELIEMRLPGAPMKGRREVRQFAFTSHLQHVWDYIETGRTLLLRDWMPTDPIFVTEVHTRPGKFRGIVTADGREIPFNDLRSDERTRIVGPDGRTALLFINAKTGGPLKPKSFREIVGDISEFAEEYAEARGEVMPHVHTHDTRHTFLTHLSALFCLGIYKGDRNLLGRFGRVDPVAAVKMASVAAGHLNEATTALYTQTVGVILEKYTRDELLGRR